MATATEANAAQEARPRARGISLIALSKILADAQTAGTIPRRPFTVPDLPPGVLPRGAKLPIACDSAMANLGWLNGQQGWCGLGFPGYTYLAELSQRSEYRAPSETMATEMTREWIELRGAGEDKLRELNDAMEDFGVRSMFAQIATTDGLFGRAQLSINVKGQQTDKARALPLVIDKEGRGLGKGQLLGFKPIEPVWTTPWTYNSLDPTQADFYRPQWWYVLGKKTHESRLLTFCARPMPDILKPVYNFSGLSMSQLIEPYVVRWLKTVDSVNRMISNYSTSGIKTDMEGTLEGGDGEDVAKRAAIFNALRDNRGLLLLDMASEEFFQYNTPLSGLSELQAQAQEHMAAPTHIPLVKLTGATPDGLNASSEGEIKVWYDYVAAYQKDFFGPHLRTVIRALQLHLWGKVDPNITHEWVALDSPTDKEESEMRKADGDRDSAYVTNGIVDADEVRERLRMDKKSGYSFVKGPAPPPPLEQQHELDQDGAEQQAERDEGKAQADHQRGEQSAQAAHGRAKELERIKSAKKGAQDAIPEFGVPVAKIIVRKRNKDGMIVEPDHYTPEDDKFYTHVRQSAVNEAFYSDPKTDGARARGFDPTGKNICGHCNKAVMIDGKPMCTKVIGGISLETGSCQFLEMPKAGDPECYNPMYTKEEAGYAENPNGWGCDGVCRFAIKAKNKDSEGRDKWCGEHGMHVMWNACCVRNKPRPS